MPIRNSFKTRLQSRRRRQGELLTEILSSVENTQTFLDMICPTTASFFTDYYIIGNTYRSVWAIREYPTSTEEQAILRGLGEKDNVTLKIYTRHLSTTEEKKIIENATNKNRMDSAIASDQRTKVEADSNLQDVNTMLDKMHKEKEPLVFCSVYIETYGHTLEQLREIEDEVYTELSRGKINIDRLLMRQKEGFLSVIPVGYNVFKQLFYRALPASSTANLYPFSYSGKTDAKGFYIGKDKGGTNIIIDLNKRADDKTNSNILILGNSGQGKSYLLKLLSVNIRESGKRFIGLDPEAEYTDLTRNMGGCYLDLMSGEYLINPMQPKLFDDGSADDNEQDRADDQFTGQTILRQHISFLKDFFRAYDDELRNFHINTLEIMIIKTFSQFGIFDHTDLSKFKNTDFPTLANLYDLIEYERQTYHDGPEKPYKAEILDNLLLSLNSMCRLNDSRFFVGHTNITSDQFLMFGMKNIMAADKSLQKAMLHNVLSYISNALLTDGDTFASIDELYLFLSDLELIERIRNLAKRVRKRRSAVILASQNVEDFLRPGVAELTKPLFSIPTYQFLFNPGSIDMKEYAKILQLETSETELIRKSQRGICLMKSGNERYHLEVTAPSYKSALFGKAGGE